ncbi:MAG: Smr/MutS family protein [Pseudomonadota bacterium]
MRRRRDLTPDDRAVWDSVARTTRRRPAERRGIAAAAPATTPSDDAPDLTAPAAQRPAEAAPHDGFLRPREGVLRRGAAHGPAHGIGEAGRGQTAGGSRAVSPAIAVREGDALPRQVGRPEAGLDRRTAERLRRGERAPDLRLDLHGMTAERAHRALDRFVAQAIGQGARMLLVITGKGGRRAPEDAPWLPEGRGVLRDAVPRWLRHGPHARRILGVYEAHLRHGGAGALYVYLKKPR